MTGNPTRDRVRRDDATIALLQNRIDVGNQALANAGLAARFRLVATERVDFPDPAVVHRVPPFTVASRWARLSRRALGRSKSMTRNLWCMRVPRLPESPLGSLLKGSGRFFESAAG